MGHTTTVGSLAALRRVRWKCIGDAAQAPKARLARFGAEDESGPTVRPSVEKKRPASANLEDVSPTFVPRETVVEPDPAMRAKEEQEEKLRAARVARALEKLAERPENRKQLLKQHASRVETDAFFALTAIVSKLREKKALSPDERSVLRALVNARSKFSDRVHHLNLSAEEIQLLIREASNGGTSSKPVSMEQATRRLILSQSLAEKQQLLLKMDQQATQLRDQAQLELHKALRAMEEKAPRMKNAQVAQLFLDTMKQVSRDAAEMFGNAWNRPDMLDTEQCKSIVDALHRLGTKLASTSGAMDGVSEQELHDDLIECTGRQVALALYTDMIEREYQRYKDQWREADELLLMQGHLDLFELLYRLGTSDLPPQESVTQLDPNAQKVKDARRERYRAARDAAKAQGPEAEARFWHKHASSEYDPWVLFVDEDIEAFEEEQQRKLATESSHPEPVKSTFGEDTPDLNKPRTRGRAFPTTSTAGTRRTAMSPPPRAAAAAPSSSAAWGAYTSSAPPAAYTMGRQTEVSQPEVIRSANTLLTQRGAMRGAVKNASSLTATSDVLQQERVTSEYSTQLSFVGVVQGHMWKLYTGVIKPWFGGERTSTTAYSNDSSKSFGAGVRDWSLWALSLPIKGFAGAHWFSSGATNALSQAFYTKKGTEGTDSLLVRELKIFCATSRKPSELASFMADYVSRQNKLPRNVPGYEIPGYDADELNKEFFEAYLMDHYKVAQSAMESLDVSETLASLNSKLRDNAIFQYQMKLLGRDKEDLAVDEYPWPEVCAKQLLNQAKQQNPNMTDAQREAILRRAHLPGVNAFYTAFMNFLVLALSVWTGIPGAAFDFAPSPAVVKLHNEEVDRAIKSLVAQRRDEAIQANLDTQKAYEQDLAKADLDVVSKIRGAAQAGKAVDEYRKAATNPDHPGRLKGQSGYNAEAIQSNMALNAGVTWGSDRLVPQPKFTSEADAQEAERYTERLRHQQTLSVEAVAERLDQDMLTDFQRNTGVTTTDIATAVLGDASANLDQYRKSNNLSNIDLIDRFVAATQNAGAKAFLDDRMQDYGKASVKLRNVIAQRPNPVSTLYMGTLQNLDKDQQSMLADYLDNKVGKPAGVDMDAATYRRLQTEAYQLLNKASAAPGTTEQQQQTTPPSPPAPARTTVFDALPGFVCKMQHPSIVRGVDKGTAPSPTNPEKGVFVDTVIDPSGGLAPAQCTLGTMDRMVFTGKATKEVTRFVKTDDSLWGSYSTALADANVSNLEEEQKALQMRHGMAESAREMERLRTEDAFDAIARETRLMQERATKEGYIPTADDMANAALIEQLALRSAIQGAMIDIDGKRTIVESEIGQRILNTMDNRLAGLQRTNVLSVIAQSDTAKGQDLNGKVMQSMLRNLDAQLSSRDISVTQDEKNPFEPVVWVRPYSQVRQNVSPDNLQASRVGAANVSVAGRSIPVDVYEVAAAGVGTTYGVCAKKPDVCVFITKPEPGAEGVVRQLAAVPAAADKSTGLAPINESFQEVAFSRDTAPDQNLRQVRTLQRQYNELSAVVIDRLNKITTKTVNSMRVRQGENEANAAEELRLRTRMAEQEEATRVQEAVAAVERMREIERQLQFLEKERLHLTSQDVNDRSYEDTKHRLDKAAAQLNLATNVVRSEEDLRWVEARKQALRVPTEEERERIIAGKTTEATERTLASAVKNEEDEFRRQSKAPDKSKNRPLPSQQKPGQPPPAQPEIPSRPVEDKKAEPSWASDMLTNVVKNVCLAPLAGVTEAVKTMQRQMAQDAAVDSGILARLASFVTNTGQLFEKLLAIASMGQLGLSILGMMAKTLKMTGIAIESLGNAMASLNNGFGDLVRMLFTGSSSGGGGQRSPSDGGSPQNSTSWGYSLLVGTLAAGGGYALGGGVLLAGALGAAGFFAGGVGRAVYWGGKLAEDTVRIISRFNFTFVITALAFLFLGATLLALIAGALGAGSATIGVSVAIKSMGVTLANVMWNIVKGQLMSLFVNRIITWPRIAFLTLGLNHRTITRVDAKTGSEETKNSSILQNMADGMAWMGVQYNKWLHSDRPISSYTAKEDEELLEIQKRKAFYWISLATIIATRVALFGIFTHVAGRWASAAAGAAAARHELAGQVYTRPDGSTFVHLPEENVGLLDSLYSTNKLLAAAQGSNQLDLTPELLSRYVAAGGGTSITLEHLSSATASSVFGPDALKGPLGRYMASQYVLSKGTQTEAARQFTLDLMEKAINSGSNATAVLKAAAQGNDDAFNEALGPLIRGAATAGMAAGEAVGGRWLQTLWDYGKATFTVGALTTVGAWLGSAAYQAYLVRLGRPVINNNYYAEGEDRGRRAAAAGRSPKRR